MKLRQLLHNLCVEVKGKKDVDIRGICSHSKKVAPGDLFIARKGVKTDGTLFMEEAMRAGAVAAVTDLYNPFLPLTQIVYESPQDLEALLAKRFYGNPSDKLFLVGITGTNGKTTTSYIVQHLLSDCGLIGTIETIIGQRRVPSSLTTPDVISVYQYLHEMVAHGRQSCVMEVTSHALMQGRVAGIDFAVGVFTNLSQDHLDYHGNMDNYASAKKKLFDQTSTAVANCDDPWMEKVIGDHCKQNLLTYGIVNDRALLRASKVHLSNKGSEFLVHYQGKSMLMQTKLVGRFNVYNCLAAIGVALTQGMALETIAQKLASFTSVTGRLQKVPSKALGHVYVDFAHTEKALENALQTLREFTEGKIITVFGCGGDRDQGKRPKMAHIAEQCSDVVIVTSDNPRSEDPLHIIEQMLQGVEKKENIRIEPDRRLAILQALSLAQKKDTVLIAGKGHEMTQAFKDRVVPFSDKAVVEEYS